FIYLIVCQTIKYNHLIDNEQLLFYLAKCTTGGFNIIVLSDYRNHHKLNTDLPEVRELRLSVI
ncbi:hypothetical protein M2451_001856, partial [Dysgonomonas sp. PFB1-18]|uniref:hypothetical protein n=1 Tax=unclassified Dysgonomonas TaxID=2630389 RepID=UPI00247465F9